MKGHNPPNKHHYLPVFLLKPWAVRKGQLCQFSRPYGESVKAKHVHPDATSYQNRLYSLDGLPREITVEVETAFFRPVDTKAAEAHKRFLETPPRWQLTNPHAQSWAQFLVTLDLRMPEDLTILRGRWAKRLEEIRHGVAIVTGASQAFQPAELEKPTFEYEVFTMLLNLNNSKVLLDLYLTMHWGVVDFSKTGETLYLSDRPIIRVPAPGTDRVSTLMPISPTRLFVAAPSFEEATRIAALNTRHNLRAINRIIVMQAQTYSYATTEGPLRFMQNNFGTCRDLRPISGNNQA